MHHSEALAEGREVPQGPLTPDPTSWPLSHHHSNRPPQNLSAETHSKGLRKVMGCVPRVRRRLLSLAPWHVNRSARVPIALRFLKRHAWPLQSDNSVQRAREGIHLEEQVRVKCRSQIHHVFRHS
ncbi:hypothetical protein DPEC_G00242530 [Dallia pectoralis]|uniref:Uncharacterized protein n=1 Tax=Dallia pectoralis TaxID=75939 RepID=A0ACC2FUY3_DALPE|nr:hypothetical protein DPEC_G00242530 [Dallia pectoralis]